MKNNMNVVLTRNSIVPFVLLFLWMQQWGFSQSPAVSNVRFEMQDSIVVILYDFMTTDKGRRTVDDFPLETEFHVDILLKKESDPDFFHRIQNATGEIGIITTGGKDKKVVWNITEEFPGGVNDVDFYFEVELSHLRASGPPLYLWFGAGALLAATGIVTYFIMSEEKNTEPVAGKFPPPPGRPN